MIDDNLQSVRARIAAACQAASRDPSGVRLLAVSKTFGADAVIEARAAGQRAFGENYVQEGVQKVTELADPTLEWHLIGPLQSNKTRIVAEHFDWVHAVDRLKIAQRLSEQRPLERGPLQVCLQVNMDAGANKAGVPPDEALALAQAVARLPHLALRGLMSIPEPTTDPSLELQIHQRTRALFDTLGQSLKAQGLAPSWDTLSMGMTADLESAILAGSTLVRVGTAIFGRRPRAVGVSASAASTA